MQGRRSRFLSETRTVVLYSKVEASSTSPTSRLHVLCGVSGARPLPRLRGDRAPNLVFDLLSALAGVQRKSKREAFGPRYIYPSTSSPLTHSPPHSPPPRHPWARDIRFSSGFPHRSRPSAWIPSRSPRSSKMHRCLPPPMVLRIASPRCHTSFGHPPEESRKRPDHSRGAPSHRRQVRCLWCCAT